MSIEKAILAAGCFWNVEAKFKNIRGVLKTSVGYTGGTTDNPTYELVCGGQTGHAEAVEIEFENDKVSYAEILDAFWKLHDPTTPDRQGPDIGRQYRSAIFYFNDEQKKIAEKSLAAEEVNWDKEIVTEIMPALTFFMAEDYHQNYVEKKRKTGLVF